MSFTEHASKKYVDERDALLATKNALAAEAQERERLANIVAQNRRDTYSKDEVNRIVEALRGARFEKVQALPELADADDRTIYLVPRGSPEAGNVYDEWIVVFDDEGARSWDKLGSTDIDLSGYAKKEWVGNEFTAKDTFNREIGSLRGQINSIGTTANQAYSDAQTAKGAADAAQRSADAAGSAANAAQSAADDAQGTADDALDAAAGAQRTADGKLDKSNGVAEGTIFRIGEFAVRFSLFAGVAPSIEIGVYDAEHDTYAWGAGNYFISPGRVGGVVVDDTLKEAIATRLGIDKMYRLVGKTPGGAECNLVWYNMQTGSTVGNVLGFTVDGEAKTVRSVYITASTFPAVSASVTDSNNVSYAFSGTAETLNLHEVATRGECAAMAAKKRDWTDVSAGTRILKWTQQGDTQYPEYVYSDAEGAWVNSHGDKIVGPRLVEAYRQGGDTFYRDKETGGAPVYSWYGSDGSLIGSASAGQLDMTIGISWAPWNVRFTVGNDKVDADRFTFRSELPDFSGETLPQYPTQNQIAEVVKTLFTKLGGTIQ